MAFGYAHQLALEEVGDVAVHNAHEVVPPLLTLLNLCLLFELELFVLRFGFDSIQICAQLIYCKSEEFLRVLLAVPNEVRVASADQRFEIRDDHPGNVSVFRARHKLSIGISEFSLSFAYKNLVLFVFRSFSYFPLMKNSLRRGEANKHCRMEFIKHVFPILGSPVTFELNLGELALGLSEDSIEH